MLGIVILLIFGIAIVIFGAWLIAKALKWLFGYKDL